MIGKIKKGKSFGGCIRYVMGKDNAEIIGSDGVLLGNNREIADSFNCQCLLNPKINLTETFQKLCGSMVEEGS